MPRALFWTLLSLPALVWAVAALRPAADLEALLHPTGELSARLLIVALALTPLARLLPGFAPLKWLVRQRRAIGLAAFGYAVLHLIFYVVAMGSLDDMLAELGARGIWTGWLALLLMLPLALTSNAAAMRALGRGWKRVQRLAYPAALLTLAHWAFIHASPWTGLAHFAPLLLLELTRLYPRRVPRGVTTVMRRGEVLFQKK